MQSARSEAFAVSFGAPVLARARHDVSSAHNLQALVAVSTGRRLGQMIAEVEFAVRSWRGASADLCDDDCGDGVSEPTGGCM